jgi:hypothetical protein
MCDKIDSVSGTTAAVPISSSSPSTSNFTKTYQNRYIESYSWSEAPIPYHIVLYIGRSIKDGKRALR